MLFIQKLFEQPKAKSKYRQLDCIERIQQSIFDQVLVTNQRLPSANDKTINIWFKYPVGALDPETNQIKTPQQTNMDESMQISNKNFEVSSIRLILDQKTLPQDVKIIHDYWVRIFIGSHDVLVVRAFMLMDLKINPCCDDCKKASTSLNNVSCGRPDPRGVYVLEEPIDLIPQQKFYGELCRHENAGILSAPVKAFLYLDGFFKALRSTL